MVNSNNNKLVSVRFSAEETGSTSSEGGAGGAREELAPIPVDEYSRQTSVADSLKERMYFV